MEELLCKKLSFADFGDDRGHLVAIEGMHDIPFNIKRIFYIYGTDEKTVRGCHANRNSEFVMINLSGSAKVKIDNGTINETAVLDKPNEGIYIPRMMWKEMFDFSRDSIMLVLSNEHYDGGEYIRSYDEFLKEGLYKDKGESM